MNSILVNILYGIELSAALFALGHKLHHGSYGKVRKLADAAMLVAMIMSLGMVLKGEATIKLTTLIFLFGFAISQWPARKGCNCDTHRPGFFERSQSYRLRSQSHQSSNQS